MPTWRFATVLSLGLILLGGIALAQPPPPYNRTFVSRDGLDSNSCLPTAPCRTFARALSHTAVEGEIIVLDSAGYGEALIIGQSVSIQAPPGVYAGMTVLDGDGITINTLGSVSLRGLTLNGIGVVEDGIEITAAAEVYLEDITVSSFNGNALNVSDNALVTIKNSEFRESNSGIHVQTTGGAAQVTVDHTILERNGGAGMFVVGPSIGIARDCIAVGNSRGFAANGSGGLMVVERAIIAHRRDFDRAAVIAFNSAILKISNSVIMNYYNAFQNYGNGATVIRRGNNQVLDVTNLYVGNITVDTALN